MAGKFQRSGRRGRSVTFEDVTAAPYPPGARVSGYTIEFGNFDAFDFSGTFTLGGKLAKVDGAKVYGATVKGAPPGSKPFAVKRVRRWALSDRRKKALFEEVRVLRSLDHPHAIQAYLFYRADLTHFSLVMELVDGGQLLDYFLHKKSYNEKEARDICRTLVDVVAHVHERGIVHRDIQPETVLLATAGDAFSLKLVSFEKARFVTSQGIWTQGRATDFVAPEILMGKRHGTTVDMWSVGLLVCILLCGRHPFYNPDPTKMFVSVAAGNIAWRRHNTTNDAKDFVHKVLTVAPEMRLTATAAKDHPWLLTGSERLASRSLEPELGDLRLYNAKRKLRGLFLTVLAANRIMLSVSSLSFSDKYFYSEVNLLGRGSYAEVFRAVPLVEADDSRSYAVKRIKRAGLSEESEQNIRDEVRILRDLHHPHMVNIHDFFNDDPNYYFIVLDVVEGGELFERIVRKRVYDEEEARDLARILLVVLEYIHSQGVVHRDLKPENILLSSKTDNSSIRLADFGFACKVDEGPVTDQLGTPLYVAPEILRGLAYGTSVDMWSAGVIIFILLTGSAPFVDKNQTRLYARIMSGDYTFYERQWLHISYEAKDLVWKLLTVDPAQRLTAAQAIKHPWLSVDGDLLSAHDLQESLRYLRLFNARRKFRTAVTMVTAANALNFVGPGGGAYGIGGAFHTGP